MKIGEVARRTGLTVDTIRYYERRGLIEAPARLESRYRDFDQSVLLRLETVKQLQQLGLTLDEIGDALRSHDRGDATCENQRWRLDLVVERIDEQLRQLTELRSAVTEMRQTCVRGGCDMLQGNRSN